MTQPMRIYRVYRDMSVGSEVWRVVIDTGDIIARCYYERAARLLADALNAEE